MRTLRLSLPAFVATTFVACVLASTVAAETDNHRRAVPLIFDTDIGNDVDNVLALGMIHALQSRGECRLLAVTITKDNQLAAAFTDAVNTFYGRGDIPIGVTRSGVTPETGKFIGLAKVRDKGKLRYPNDLVERTPIPDAVKVLRSALAAAEDRSVAVVQVGFSTNLAALLNTSADDISPLNGVELVARKVKLLSVMAGAFAPIQGKVHREYNVVKDIPSAKTLAERWPTKTIYSGFEIGIAVPYPSSSIEKDYGYVEHHPLADAYRLYKPPPHNRPTWDLTSVLVAVRPERGYFGMSSSGQVLVRDDGETTFRVSDGGRHRFLKLTAAQRPRVIEALVLLSSQPPSGSSSTIAPRGADNAINGAGKADKPAFRFIESSGQLELLLHGKSIGRYVFRHDKLTRPAWIDVRTPSGIRVTRNFPPRLPEDEDAMDHELMHPGIWISFGHLDGQDYWRLKARTEHVTFIQRPHAERGSAGFAVRNRYHSEDGKRIVCEEITRYRFSLVKNGVAMRVETQFRSDTADFYFGDQEESGLAFRVDSRLRVKGGSGTIENDRGERNGQATWGKQAKWISYLGTIDGRRVGIKVTPDPKNPRPCWMHTRDYGIVACNPFPKQPKERREPYVKTWVKKGKPFQLAFDVLIHDAPADRSRSN